MLASFKSKLKSFISRIPIVGRLARLIMQFLHMPAMAHDILGRFATLHDQVLAQPNMWAPLSEQVWEAQAAGAQIMSDDLRAAVLQIRREQAQLIETLHRRLDSMEKQFGAMATASASTMPSGWSENE